MDLESTLTLILGTGFVTSFITIVATYFLDLKQKEKDREIEKTDNLIAQVYSPLKFYFFEMTDFLGNSIGNLNGYSESGSSEQDLEFLRKRLGQTLKFFQSESLRELLINKIGFVKPAKFGKDLLVYFIMFREYERKVAAFSSGKLLIKNKEAEKVFLRNLLEAANKIMKITFSFGDFVDKLVNKDDPEKGKAEYVEAFSVDDFNNVLRLLHVPY